MAGTESWHSQMMAISETVSAKAAAKQQLNAFVNEHLAAKTG